MTATVSETIAATTSDIAITFPDGLVGCQDWKQFVLLTDDGGEDLPVAILQSIQDESISLLVTDPRFIDADYAPAVSTFDLADLDLADASSAIVYCTLSTNSGWLTANLLGPLVVNPFNRRAKQIVQIDSGYTTKHPVAQLISKDS